MEGVADESKRFGIDVEVETGCVFLFLYLLTHRC
jgi:hypothetical protein